MTTWTMKSKLKDIYRHPVGHDIIAKILLQVGRLPKWLTNPVVGNLSLQSIQTLTRGKLDQAFFQKVLNLLNGEQAIPRKDDGSMLPAWWKEAVFYQIYPRSFQDSNGDGIGDLPGIIDRLDYLQELGITAVWLSPIYDSPNDDMGYDIRNYQKIMAEFGTMADFDRLRDGLHARGMKLIMDLVVNHTSDEHPWFQKALADPSGPFGQYYFLRPGQPDTPPNNWTSFFSGSAWRWFPEQQLWGLHLFSPKQMDLNWSYPPVRDAVCHMVNWWLDRGVDGFRLDVINYIAKNPGLPAGDPLIGQLMGFTGVEEYFYGRHLHEYLRELQERSFTPHHAFSVGETPGVGMQMSKLLTGDYRHELDMVFDFDVLETPGHVRWDDYRYDLNYLRDYLADYQDHYGSHYWQALFIENHDNPRMISKVNPDPQYRIAIAKLLAVIELTLRGTPFIFQGQELGRVNAQFHNIRDFQDVESINKYHELLAAGQTEQAALAVLLAGSRDHARTPMPWDTTPHGGFTTGTPWLAGDDDYRQYNAYSEMANPRSVWSTYRHLIKLRQANPVLVYGATDTVDRRRNAWSYIRRDDDHQPIQVLINLSARQKRMTIPAGGSLLYRNYPAHDGRFKAYEARVYRLPE